MKNLKISLWANLARAYEVALLGGFGVCVYWDGEEYLGGAADYAAIKSVASGVRFVGAGGDGLGPFLRVEICQPGFREVSQMGRLESLEVILERVEAARGRVVPTEVGSPAAHDALLKVAAERSGMGVTQIQAARVVSGVIAQLDGATKIGVEHLAEAIQYVAVFKDEHDRAVYGEQPQQQESILVPIGVGSVRLTSGEVSSMHDRLATLQDAVLVLLSERAEASWDFLPKAEYIQRLRAMYAGLPNYSAEFVDEVFSNLRADFRDDSGGGA